MPLSSSVGSVTNGSRPSAEPAAEVVVAPQVQLAANIDAANAGLAQGRRIVCARARQPVGLPHDVDLRAVGQADADVGVGELVAVADRAVGVGTRAGVAEDGVSICTCPASTVNGVSVVSGRSVAMSRISRPGVGLSSEYPALSAPSPWLPVPANRRPRPLSSPTNARPRQPPTQYLTISSPVFC